MILLRLFRSVFALRLFRAVLSVRRWAPLNRALYRVQLELVRVFGASWGASVAVPVSLPTSQSLGVCIVWPLGDGSGWTWGPRFPDKALGGVSASRELAIQEAVAAGYLGFHAPLPGGVVLVPRERVSPQEADAAAYGGRAAAAAALRRLGADRAYIENRAAAPPADLEQVRAELLERGGDSRGAGSVGNARLGACRSESDASAALRGNGLFAVWSFVAISGNCDNPVSESRQCKKRRRFPQAFLWLLALRSLQCRRLTIR
jgi:hypothetical protein